MKYALLFLILITPFVYAQDIIIAKESYFPKETFQAEVFLENIKPEDISILNPIGYSSSIGVNLMEITDSHYFIFFDIPSEIEPGVYTVKIKSIKEQFEIKPKKQDIISISPPVIKFTPEKSQISKIAIYNHDIKSKSLEIKSSDLIIKPSVNSLIIPPKSSKSFYVNLGEKPGTNKLAVLSVSDYYKIPIWFIVDNKIIPFLEKIIQVQEMQKQGLNFYTESGIQLNFIMKDIQESVPITDSIYVKNDLNETLKNIKISLTGNLQDIVKIDIAEIDDLVPNGQKKLDIIVNEDRLLLEDSYSGDLSVATDKNTFRLPISFTVVEEAEEPESLIIEEIPEPIEEPEENKTISGKKEEPKKSKTKTVYIIFLILLLIVFVYIALKKPKIKKQTFKEYIRKTGY